MTDVEVLLFVETLASQINADLQLGLTLPVIRRIALRVAESDYDGAQALHDSLGQLLIRERTLH